MSIASVTDERSARLLPVYLITVGVSHNQEPCRRPNGAPFHHIMYVEKGEGMFEVGGKKALLKEGSTVFIRKGTPSNYYAVGKPFQTGWITFGILFCRGVFLFAKRCAPCSNPIHLQACHP